MLIGSKTIKKHCCVGKPDSIYEALANQKSVTNLESSRKTLQVSSYQQELVLKITWSNYTKSHTCTTLDRCSELYNTCKYPKELYLHQLDTF